MDEATLSRVVEAAVAKATSGSVPLLHATAAFGALIAALGWQTKRAANSDKRAEAVADAYLDFAKTATPILASVNDRLKELSHGKE
jgi:hypothetical protein